MCTLSPIKSAPIHYYSIHNFLFFFWTFQYIGIKRLQILRKRVVEKDLVGVKEFIEFEQLLCSLQHRVLTLSLSNTKMFPKYFY